MANFYERQLYTLNTTNLTTVLTINTSSVAIVKTVQASENDNTQVDVDVVLNSTVISHDTIQKSTVNLLSGVLNLQAGDVLKIQADTANKITGVVSYLRIDRSQENG
jgi:carbonic anhydrase